MYSNVINYYCDLLQSQYRYRTKARATIEALVKKTIDGFFDNVNISNCFDLDTATGEQLTILGKWVGIPRTLYGVQVLNFFWKFSQLDTPRLGMSTLDNVEVGKFKRLTDINTGSYSFSDDNMRFFIKMKIILNNCNGSSKDIDQLLYDFFGDDVVVVDTYNKIINYYVNPLWQPIFDVLASQNWIPKNQGVKLNVIYQSYSN